MSEKLPQGLVVMVAVMVVVVIARVELLAPVHDRVLVRLVDLDLVQQLRLGHHQLEGVPDKEGHVFGGTWQVFEVRHVLVQVEMVQLLHDGLVHVLLQVGDVHYHSGFGVHWTSYSDLDGIVVAVSIRVVTLAVHLTIGFFAEKGTM